MQLRIDPEFESRIPPLTDDEFQQLEENILADGVRWRKDTSTLLT